MTPALAMHLGKMARELAASPSSSDRRLSVLLVQTMEQTAATPPESDDALADQLLSICAEGLARLASRATARGEDAAPLATAARTVRSLIGFVE